MISHEYKFIFIHLNRTGGTSIEKLFNSEADKEVDGFNIIEDPNKHLSAKQTMEIYPEEFKTYFKFSFVRNPWDLVVSRYHWSRYQKINGQPLIPSDTFNKFMQRMAILHDDLRNYDEKLDGPAWIYLQSLRNQISRISIDSRIVMDFVGKFENLENDWKLICQNSLNLPEKFHTLPHVFKSRRQDYRAYYDENSKKTVSDWFARDIEKFKYTF